MKKLPSSIVRRQTVLVERVAKEIENILIRYQGDIEAATPDIRKLYQDNLGDLEYFVIVNSESFGLVHTNRLREAVYFSDPVGLKCAAVQKTEAFYYPRNTGEQLIDVSTPIFYNGEKRYALRSGSILMGISHKWKLAFPLIALQVIGISLAIITKDYWMTIVMIATSVLIIYEENRFRKYYMSTLRFMRAVASGELDTTLRPRVRDEWGQLQFELNKVGIGIKSIIKRIQETADGVKSGVEQTSSAISDTSAGAEELTSSAEEIHQGALNQSGLLVQSQREMEDVSSQMNEIDRNVMESQRLLNETRIFIEGACSQLSRVEQDIGRFLNTMQQSSRGIVELKENVSHITSLTKGIGEISEQTKMLSLNASIEAARAGEYGKGFAVVAGEVGLLSAHTDELTQQVQHAVQELGERMNITNRMMSEQEISVDQSQKSLLTLTKGVQSVTNSFQSLYGQMESTRLKLEASQKARNQITDNMAGISRIVQTFEAQSAGIKQSSQHQAEKIFEIVEATQQLQNVLNSLNGEIERFHV